MSADQARPIVLPAEALLDGPTRLRPWRDSDLPALVAACQDPEVSRFTRVPVPYGEADGRAYLMTRHNHPRAGISAPFAIVDARNDSLAGSISLMRFAWPHRRAEVGYWLDAAARGAGHATRAVELVCAWGFRQLGLERIDLLASTENPASQRVAERAGFRREAVLRSYFQANFERQDMVAFGRLSGESAR